jgi:hypothetical protein
MPGKRLTVLERRVIENCVEAGAPQRQIAAVLGRSASTICRELARNHKWWYAPSSPLRHTPRRRLAAYRYCYRATSAQRRAAARARRPKTRRLAGPRLWQVVTDLPPGKAAPTKTPTAYSASTGPKTPTCATSPKPTATTSPTGSIPGHDAPELEDSNPGHADHARCNNRLRPPEGATDERCGPHSVGVTRTQDHRPMSISPSLNACSSSQSTRRLRP